MMNKKIKRILISILGGLYGTSLICSFFYFLIIRDITYLCCLGIPLLLCFISSTIYDNLKDGVDDE